MAYALVELTIEFRLWHLYHDCLADIYYSADRLFHPQIFFFDLNILKNESRLAQALRPFFSNLQLNTETDNYRRLIHDLSQDGLRMSQWAFNQGFHGIVLPLISQIEACVVEHNSDDWFYSDEYAMIPATESSINLMLNKVRVEAEAEVEDCCICLEELKVGSDAAQMPCAHVFHADCIEKWLYTSHYCPICSDQSQSPSSEITPELLVESARSSQWHFIKHLSPNLDPSLISTVLFNLHKTPALALQFTSHIGFHRLDTKIRCLTAPISQTHSTTLKANYFS
ncbi:hypothetical protein V6N13_105256 [Hibiscus sabdariffa]